MNKSVMDLRNAVHLILEDVYLRAHAEFAETGLL